MMQSLFSGGEKGFLYDFSKVTGSSGALVTSVPDLSGNGNDIAQGSASKQPKISDFGSKRGISFDGVDDALVRAGVDLTGTTSFTLLLAIRYYGAALGVPLEFGSSPYTGTGGFGFYFNNGHPALGSGIGTLYSAYSFLNCPVSTEGQPAVVAVTFRPSESTLTGRQDLRLNGVDVAENDAGSVGTPTTSLFTVSGLYLGGRTASSYFARCDLFGVIGIARALTPQEMSASEAWLMQLLPPTMNKSRRHFDIHSSLTRADRPAYIEADAFSYAEFSTEATAIEVESYTTMASLFPALADIGVVVNGQFLQKISHGADGTQKATVALPVGSKVVRIVNGPQARANGTPGEGWRGTWIKSFAADAPLRTAPSGECLFVYGDSIATGAWAMDTQQNAWIPKVRKALGIRVVSKAIGSQTLNDDCATLAAARDFADQIARTAPTKIWLAIGTNDFGLSRWSAADFGSAYGNLLDAIRELMPLAKIYAQTPLLRAEPGIVAYRTAIAAACANRPSVILVDGTTIMPQERMPDGIHPDTAGHDLYASFVTAKLQAATL